MSAAKPITTAKRMANYRKQSGRNAPTAAQLRRIDRKARKRLGFVDYAHVFPALRRESYLSAPLFDPKAIVTLTGTGA